jgi:hypothetical protein
MAQQVFPQPDFALMSQSHVVHVTELGKCANIPALDGGTAILDAPQNLRDDIRGLRDNIRGLRDDVRGLKDDFRGLVDSIRGGLKDDVRGLKDELTARFVTYLARNMVDVLILVIVISIT